jgi:hypothetical protein
MVTYFDEGCRIANRDAGLKGFWMGYFASRAAPLGPVGPGVVEALFFNFTPTMVRKSIPVAWSLSEPSAIVESRRHAASDALVRAVPGIEEVASRVVPVLDTCVRSAPGSGRPLFCANRDVVPSEHPVESLWQLATTLREHRGDGHVWVLGSKGLSGCEPHHLIAAESGIPAEVLRDNRGWSEEEWQSAGDLLVQRGLLDDRVKLTPAGNRMREEIELAIDELAATAYPAVGDAGVEELIERLYPPARVISRSGIVPYPNPAGLPPFP